MTKRSDRAEQDQRVEKDPSGKLPNEAGAKLDAGKLRPALVVAGFARALTAVAEVGTFGANKYTANGWITVPNGIERYEDAQLRHYLREKTGELCDTDSGLLHAAHGAWNALARLDLILREKENNESQRGNAYVLATALYARDKSKPIEDIAEDIYNLVDSIDFGSDERKADLYAQLAERLQGDTPFAEVVSIVEEVLLTTNKRYPYE